jgi:hypothetical protein
MVRAGVFIGVDKTGNLQRLTDAAAGAERMHQWALGQGVPPENAKLITDANGKVAPDQIYDAIKQIIDGAGVDQLLLYFAGHGVNISRGEQWLLSDAPIRTSAAVNVAGSVDLARYCGIQHVVIISDACRVAPEGIQAQNVRGVDVFPNDGIGDRAKPVDQFFACLLGKTAAELSDPTVAAGNYSALYTNVLLDALKGSRVDVLEPSDTANDTSQYVKPRRLENYLESEVPRRVRAMNLQQKVNQNPDAIITSDKSWLARFAPPPPPEGRGGGPREMERSIDFIVAFPGSVGDGEPPSDRAPVRRASSPQRSPTKNLRSVAQQLVRSAATGGKTALETELRLARATQVNGADELAGAVERIATPFGPDHFETECGIKVRGAHIVDFLAPRAHGEILGTDGNLLRISALEGPGVSVLVRFDTGVGALIPAVKGFLGALTFDEGELVDVAYEPSDNTWRWDMFKQHSAEIRALRAVAASASQHGRFRLDQPDAEQVAQRMQYAKGVDPTLSVYAAYAYNDRQDIDRISRMSGYLRGDIGVTFFDLALLGRTLIDKSIRPADFIVPFVPLLSQGWALLNAHRVKLHPALRDIQSSVRDSLWSLFDESGVRRLAKALQSGDVR